MSPAGIAEPTSTRRPVAREEAAGYLTLLVVAFVITVTARDWFRDWVPCCPDSGHG
jgi:hypothetical protein